VFEGLQTPGWPDVSGRIGRGSSETIDALNSAMSMSNHHDWIKFAADRLTLGGDILWQALAAAWAKNCASEAQRIHVSQPIRDALDAASI
jgi:hypothetical protein